MADRVKEGETALILVGVGVGAYLLYQLWQSVKGTVTTAASAIASGVQAGANAVAAPIASAIVWATSGSSIVPTGNVVMPDGTLVPMGNLALTFDDTANAATFVYNGQIYWIVPNPSGGPSYDSSGNYHATTTAPVPSILSVL